MDVVVVTTPVAPLGSGIGGGVEANTATIVGGLASRGHDVSLVAPAGSAIDGGLARASHVALVDGEPPASALGTDRTAAVSIPPGSIVPAMWSTAIDLARRRGAHCLLNLGYDWLPLYLTRVQELPILHLVSMGSLYDAFDEELVAVASARPGVLAAHSTAQAATFPVPDAFRIVGSGMSIPPDAYRSSPDDPPALAYVGRISPEKGVERVAEVSARTGLPVRVWGLVQDADYWQWVRAAHPGARLEHRGFVPPERLHRELGGARALLMLHHWVEAFGNVAIEALATGVPVITFDRGGPAEIVDDGVTGFVVPPDDVPAVAAAVERVGQIDRRSCRQAYERGFTADAVTDRIERWLTDVVGGRARR